MDAEDFQLLFESAPALCLALLPDAPRYTIAAVSDAYARATLTRREDIVGRGLFEVFPDNPDGGRNLGASLQRVLDTGHGDPMAVQRYDVRRPVGQGGGFEPRWWSLLNAPVFGQDGRVAFLLHRVEDVTDFVRPRQDGTWTTQHADGGVAHPEVWARMLSDGRCLALLRDATQRNQRELAALALADELERRVAQRTEQLHRLAADLEAAEGRERRQLARDLHDDLGQVLAAASIRLAPLCRDARADVRSAAVEVAELVKRANRSTRSLAAQLAPAVLYELGFGAALEWLAEELSSSFGLGVTIVDDAQPKLLSQEARSIGYRVVRELLINVAKHACVSTASVHLACVDGRLVVRVSDVGVGFAIEEAGAPRKGLGLVSVAERLSFVGGTFNIRSIPGDGTEATLSLPLDPDQTFAHIPV